jgi:hypothetical protein
MRSTYVPREKRSGEGGPWIKMYPPRTETTHQIHEKQVNLFTGPFAESVDEMQGLGTGNLLPDGTEGGLS